MKYNSISDIYLIIRRDISDYDYDTIPTIEKYIEIVYYIVKWTSKICTLQSYQKLGKYVINTSELVYDEVYLNQLSNFKQLCTPYED